MAGKQAKVLSEHDIQRVLKHLSFHRHPERDRVIFLLSVRAGLRASEIAQLTWPMLLAANGRIAKNIELHDRAAKKRSGRCIPLRADLQQALRALSALSDCDGAVVRSERGGGMTPASVVNWFRHVYEATGLLGCSSHSGRRTFITMAARKVYRAGGSLRDVQMLAGHKSIEMTQRYIDSDSAAQRRLVNLL